MASFNLVTLTMILMGAFGATGASAMGNERTCAELVAKIDRLNATERRVAELCQLIEMADGVNEATKALMEGLVNMLAEQGLKVIKEDEESEPNDAEPNIEKRKTEFLRFGKRDNTGVEDENAVDLEKRKTEFLRFGKKDQIDQQTPNEVEKRKTEFLRFGKRKTEFLRFGKRKFSLRLGKRSV